jgi:hypothetical protein
MDAGYPRKPLLPLEKSTSKKLENALEKTKDLWDLA